MIATNDIGQAQREAAMDRAHEMCIDKIKEMEKWLKRSDKRNIRLIKTGNERIVEINTLKAENDSIVKANHGLIDTQNRLQGEIGTMTAALEQIAALDHYSDSDNDFTDSGSIARNALN